MNQKHIYLIIAVTFFSLIANTAFALDYILLNPQTEAPPVTCDASREGSMYYGYPGNVVHVCDSTQNWSSMGAEGNISPLTVTTTDGLIYLNNQGQEGNIYQSNIIFGYDDLQLRSDPGDNAGIFLEDDSGINPYIGFYTKGTLKMTINNAGNVSIPTGGSLTVTDLGNCDQVKTIAGLLDCGTDADTWVANSQATAGYVAAGGTNNNKVWKTDGSGIPSWRDDATAGTISGTAGEVAFFNSGTSITSDTGLSWDNTNKKLNVNSPTGSAGDVNAGSAGFYSYNTASRYLRFNTNGTYNDLLSYGAPLTINHSGEQDIFMNVGGGSVGIGTASPRTDALLDVAGAVGVGRQGIGGTYNSLQVQGIWSIAPNYKISTANNDFGSQYGITYAHTNAGTSGTKKPIANWGHQILFTSNGTRNAAISLTSGHAYFAGKVGIGTITPRQKLDINGSLHVGGADIILGTDDGRDQGTNLANRAFVHWGDTGFNDSTDSLVMNFFGDFEGGVRMHGPGLVVNGSLGIGTVPKSKLHVAGRVTFQNPFELMANMYYPGDAFLEDGYAGRIEFVKGQGKWSFQNTTETGVADESVSGKLTTHMTIQPNGNVGIGMTSPPYKLSINPGASQYALGIAYNSATAVQWIIGSNSSGNLIFHEEYVGDKVTFEAGGDVGIGTTPSYKLDVNGTIRARDFTGAGGQNIIVGDDTYLTDIDDGNMLGIYGMQNSDRAGIRLGSDGSYIFGDNGRVGIGTKNPRTALDVGSGDIITDGAYYGPHKSGVTSGLILRMEEKNQYCVWVFFRCDPPATSYPSCPSGYIEGDTYGPLYPLPSVNCGDHGSGTCSSKLYKKTYRACLKIYAGP